MHPANESRKVSLYLQTKQPCSSILAGFQLWLAHLQDSEKTIHKGTVTFSCQIVVLMSQQVFASCRRCALLH